MSRPSQSPLRRAAWDIAALADEDRTWIVAQLTRDERARLVGVLGEADTQPAGQSVGDVLEVAALPRWLAARALRALPNEQRSAHLKRLRVIDRWRTALAMRAAADAPLTPLAEQMLLACLSAPKEAIA